MTNDKQFNVNEINTRTINRKELLALLNTNEQKVFKAFVKSVTGQLMIKFNMNNYVWFEPTRLGLRTYNMYWLDKGFDHKLE